VPHGHQPLASVVEQRLARGDAIGEQDRRQVVGIERPAGRQVDAGQAVHGGEQVHRTGHLPADPAGGDLPGPPEDARHPHAPLPCRPLTAPQQPSRSAVELLDQPGAVVTGKDHHRAIRQFEFAERPEDLAGAPVELLDHVAVEATGTAALEVGRRMERRMRKRMGQVKKERGLPMAADELNGRFRIAAGEGCLIDGPFDFLAATDQVEWFHVVAIGCPEEVIEATLHR